MARYQHNTTSTTKPDIYANITAQIIAQMEHALEWQKPWNCSGGKRGNTMRPMNIEGRKYRGINVLALWAASEAKGYDSPIWATFKAWKAVGAMVNKGERASSVVFWKKMDKENAETGEDESFWMARSYCVFNIAQVSGAPAKFMEPAMVANAEERNATAEKFFAATGLTIRHGSNRAFYSRSEDFIQIPEFASFVPTETSTAAEAFYSTIAHECAHATGAAHRLNRVKGKRFADDDYSREEMVAELSAAFVLSDLGIAAVPRADHAAYVKSWLTVLQADKRAIFSAASHAEKACDWLHKAAGTEFAEDSEEAEAEITADPVAPSPEPVQAPSPVAAPVAAEPAPATSRKPRKARKTPSIPVAAEPAPTPSASIDFFAESTLAAQRHPLRSYKPKKKNWRERYSVMPRGATKYQPADCRHAYTAWLMASRGWTQKEASDYIAAMPTAQLLTAQHSAPLALAA